MSEHEFRLERRELSVEQRQARALERIAEVLERVFGNTQSARSATLQISNSKGEPLMAKVLQVGQTAQAVFTEFSGLSGAGVALPPAGAIAFVSDDPTVATVDSSTGLVTAVAVSKKDANGAVIPVKITGTDQVNSLSASDFVSDTPVVAQSATLVIQ